MLERNPQEFNTDSMSVPLPVEGQPIDGTIENVDSSFNTPIVIQEEVGSPEVKTNSKAPSATHGKSLQRIWQVLTAATMMSTATAGEQPARDLKADAGRDKEHATMNAHKGSEKNMTYEERVHEFVAQLNVWVKDLGNPDISIRESKVILRSINFHYAVYYKDKHAFEIEGVPTTGYINEGHFLKDMLTELKSHGIAVDGDKVSEKIVAPEPTIKISAGAKVEMEKKNFKIVNFTENGKTIIALVLNNDKKDVIGLYDSSAKDYKDGNSLIEITTDANDDVVLRTTEFDGSVETVVFEGNKFDPAKVTTGK